MKLCFYQLSFVGLFEEGVRKPTYHYYSDWFVRMGRALTTCYWIASVGRACEWVRHSPTENAGKLSIDWHTSIFNLL